MEELHIQVLEGRWGPQVEYALRYPATCRGGTPFDRYWRQRAHSLRHRASREPGRFPTRYVSEWQETRRDSRFCSGFLEVSRQMGHGDWTLWRISGTFGPKSVQPVMLSVLLGQNWKQRFYPLLVHKMEALADGETPFFRNWQRRMGAFLDGGRYYLTHEGLCIWFPQEALAPKNAGLPTVLLPYDSLDILSRLC